MGVAISILLHVAQSSNRIELVEFVPVEAGFPVEQAAPAELQGDAVKLLYPHGSLFFASASNFEESLPKADTTRRAVAILILRGQKH